ncbi:MAG: hypothetical protein LBV62_04015 [Rickettsiales bacterium]|jgi:predicted MFS family arabinose efflux permease|nr:hypothetical protein [Rickettsiales bacterium]
MKSNLKKINKKWLAIGAGSLLFAMMLPSVLLLAKIAIGLIMVSVAAIAVKVALKTISNTLEDKQADQSQAMQQTTQSKIINLAIGLVSIFTGGLSLFIIAKTGFIAACAAVSGLVLYEYVKDEEVGKNINTKLDKIADNTTNFVVSSVEALIPSQDRQA